MASFTEHCKQLSQIAVVSTAPLHEAPVAPHASQHLVLPVFLFSRPGGEVAVCSHGLTSQFPDDG